MTESDLAEGIYDGHIFVGWFTDAACTQAYVLGPVTTDIELYAKWQEEAVEKPVTAISLSPAEKTLKSKGETVDLAVSFTPSDATNKEIIWNSSDPAVARVADGRVTAVANGETTITATAQGAADGNIVTAEAKIRVEIPAVAKPVTGISLSPEKKTLTKKDETAELNVSFTPDDATDKTLDWESSDTGVATVKDGIVTAWQQLRQQRKEAQMEKIR